MIRLINLTILLIAFQITVCAQTRINTSIGYGAYSMETQKNFHQYFINSINQEIGIDLNLLENFPPYYIYSGEIEVNNYNDLSISIGFSYQSTGARSYYADYSGKLYYDITINGVGPYISFDKELFSFHGLKLSMQVKPQLLFGHENFSSNFKITGYSEKETIKMRSYNIGIEPSVKLTKEVSRFIIFFNAGYYLDTYRGHLKTNISGEMAEVFIPNTDENLKINWNGFRLNTGIGIGIN